MGAALAAGLTSARPALAAEIVVIDADADAAVRVAAELGARVGDVAAAAACDLICVAVKPKDVAGVLAAIAEAGPGGTILSVAAGWTLDRLAAAAPGAPIVRTMPNLAVRHRRGMIAVAHRGLTSERERAILELLGDLGTAVVLPEPLFAAATALAGSGPGILALVAEALEEGALRAGLSRAQARPMVQAVLAGTAELLADGTDPADLRQRVSSPAGTTLAALAVLERGAVRARLADAVLAAAERAEQL